jgi:EAL domain-containing protein (putative c-di-GMP-specific phosphodiesterase class I)
VFWRETGLNLQISVNVSAANLLEPDFTDCRLAGLTYHSLPASGLELEITEGAVMEDAVRATAALEAIACAGIRLAIDDFGTGYSSLSYLQRLPTHVVKIDQSFILDLVADPRKRSLVSALISLSHEFGYRVVAEGVETGQVLDLLEVGGCDEAQGYFLGRPMAPVDFVAWCRDGPYAPHIHHAAEVSLPPALFVSR